MSGDEKSWEACVLTLYPDMFPGVLGSSLAGKGLENGLWSLDVAHIREFGLGKHKDVDDTPAGGGPGMVMRADVLGAAIEAHVPKGDKRPIIALSPRGKALTQKRVRELSAGEGVVLICGRFEGFDERIVEEYVIEEVSIGDFVLQGGEVAALCMLEACIRLLPGIMGSDQSGEHESFENGLLEYPHYTRPREWKNREIPPVLLSGDHEKIAQWRLDQAEELTRKKRPDLWENYTKGAKKDP
jgi:tRNA (guanine37-N1)-methyltransferase